VGLSGSGKSTILNLLRRYYDPLLGEILIDGVPLVDLDLQWYRRQIGNVDQDIKLFDQSIRANILLGADPNTSEEVLQKAIDNASLRDFIDKLPAGVDTLVGEGGIKVSGGERQRIGIARALVKNPKILIFDEATSSLDAFNEALIHDAIMKNAHGRTTIIIAHRLSTVRNADCIFVVSEGKIVGQGTHDELLVTCPEYQNLIKHQLV
jgi:ATP-binding cassette subfamily B (MDR/TAP) protein 1